MAVLNKVIQRNHSRM